MDPEIFVKRGGGGGGGGGGGVLLVINLFYSLQSGSNGLITEGRRGSNFFQGVGGVQRNPYNL